MDSSTAPIIADNRAHHQLYSPYGPLPLLSRGPLPVVASSASYFSRHQAALRCYPHPTSDCSAYYSIYGCYPGAGGAAGRSTSESGIYSPTRRLRPAEYAHLQNHQLQQLQQQQYYHNNNHSYHHRRKSSADAGSGLDDDFDIANAIFALIALTAYLVSFGSSLALAYFLHHHEQDGKACALTLAATILPSVIVNILSLKW